jgi:hypothetical protein
MRAPAGTAAKEADAVEAVVYDTAKRATNPHRLREKMGQQGQGKIAVGDGGAVGRSLERSADSLQLPERQHDRISLCYSWLSAESG